MKKEDVCSFTNENLEYLKFFVVGSAIGSESMTAVLYAVELDVELVI